MSMRNLFRLKNGLRVYVQESRSAPVVAIQIWSNVGSADETPNEAGVAHQLEHMMFKGTDRRDVGVVAREVESAGGEINAFTSFDHTVYYVTMASRHFDHGLDILADVIQHSKIDEDELRLEKEVVLEEVRRYLDTPSRQLDQALFRTIFNTHPYGRPVIGYEETVRAFERSDVHGFYKRWYTPENMVLVIVGDVDTANVKKKVRRAFANFDRTETPRRPRPAEPEQHAPRFVRIDQAVQEAMFEVGFPIPSASHPDAPLLDLLALILGQGESSRLIEGVKNQKQLVNSTYAFAYTPRDGGVFLVGSALEPRQLMKAYEAILDEIQQVRTSPVRGSELRKAQSIIRSDRVYERETVDGRARKFGYYLSSFGTLDAEKTYYRAIEEATLESLLQAAQTYLDPKRLNIGILTPKGMEVPEGERFIEVGREKLSKNATPVPDVVIRRRERETLRLTMPNGIRLLIRQNRSVPLVAMRAVFEGGLRYEKKPQNGIFHLMAQTLTRGTPHRDAFQIAHEVESLAGGLGGFSGRNSFGLRAEFLSQHLERGVELFSEILRGPAFDQGELEKTRRTTLEALRNQEDHPSSYAFRLFGETLYRKHPFRMSMLGNPNSVKRITANMLRQNYERFAMTGNMVIGVVGDVDPQDIEALLARHFGTFRTGTPRFPDVPIEPPLARRRVALFSSEKQQLHIVVGWRGLPLEHPDRYVMHVLSSVLSGQGGRLFLELRDRQGLAYSVTSLSMEALGEGFFAIYMATEPAKFERARAGILKEVEKVLDSGITQEEISRAKRYLVGSYEIELQRAAALCSNIAFNELYGLGYDSYKEYANRIEAVTRDQVLHTARRYLDIDKYVLTALGPQQPSDQ